MATVNWSLQHKRDTAANWTANNPTLLAGQLGIETDGLTTTPKFKIGDGVTAWNTLPYFYGGSASAQDLNNVLTVGNTTSGQDIVLTDDDKLQIGSTAGRYICYDTNLIQIGLGIVNTNSNDHIVLQDGGGIHVDTTFVELPHLTASRVIATDANNRLIALTGTGILTLTGGAISYDTNTYLTTAAAALAYQPLDADLTSWAGVTRASGFDTFTATPSSANLSSLLTDKTGTGVNVFGTSPTFTTDITTPTIYGSSSASGNLTIQSTSNATKGTVFFGASSSDQKHVFYVGTSTGQVQIRSLVGTLSQTAIYLGVASGSESSSNYTLNWSGSLNINSQATTSAIDFQQGSQSRFTMYGASTSGSNPRWLVNFPQQTNITASTETPDILINSKTQTWAGGNISTQRGLYWKTQTYAFTSASTITNSYGLYVEAATAGTNATITNNWALGTNGGIFLNGTANTVLGNAALATNATTGFLHVPSCAGTPTGTPTLYTGMIPVCADSTNNKLYIYSGGAWVALN